MYNNTYWTISEKTRHQLREVRIGSKINKLTRVLLNTISLGWDRDTQAPELLDTEVHFEATILTVRASYEAKYQHPKDH